MMQVQVRGAEAKAEGTRLEELYRRHASDATRLAYLITGDRHLAEDIAQDAFVRCIGRFHDLRSPDAFGFYLRRIVVNLTRSHFRHRRVERAWLERQRATESGPTEPDVGTHDELWTALLTLPERQRTAIVLRYYEDLSEAQAADVLRCPVGTVKSLVSRGMERLRAELPRGE